jgi:hypothetical protein
LAKSINLVITVAETECVYCAIRTESLNKVPVYFHQLLSYGSQQNCVIQSDIFRNM